MSIKKTVCIHILLNCNNFNILFMYMITIRIHPHPSAAQTPSPRGRRLFVIKLHSEGDAALLFVYGKDFHFNDVTY